MISGNNSEKYDIYHEHLMSTINQHAPLKTLTKKEIKMKSKPWITTGILKSISIRTKYYKKFMILMLRAVYI